MRSLRFHTLATSAAALIFLAACGGADAPAPVVLTQSQPDVSAPASRITALLNLEADGQIVGAETAVGLSSWQPDSEVRVEVWDGPAQNQLLATGTVQTDEEGDGTTSGLTLAWGMFIVATDGVTTKEFTLVELTVAADAVGDVVSGTAPAGSTVSVGCCGSPDNTALLFRNVTADGARRFRIDFSDPAGGPVADIVVGRVVIVSVSDGGGDGTHLQFLAQ